MQRRRHIRVDRLLVGQGDVQAQVGRAQLERSPVGRFHHAGPATGANKELVVFGLVCAVLSDQAGKLAGLLVPDRVAHVALSPRLAVRVPVFLSHRQTLGRHFRRHKACAAKHHDGVCNALAREFEFGLEHFQLKPNAARFRAQQKFGVGKGQSGGVGTGQFLRLVLELAPLLGHLLGRRFFCVFHEGIVRYRREDAAPQKQKAPEGAFWSKGLVQP